MKRTADFLLIWIQFKDFYFSWPWIVRIYIVAMHEREYKSQKKNNFTTLYVDFVFEKKFKKLCTPKQHDQTIERLLLEKA